MPWPFVGQLDLFRRTFTATRAEHGDSATKDEHRGDNDEEIGVKANHTHHVVVWREPPFDLGGVGSEPNYGHGGQEVRDRKVEQTTDRIVFAIELRGVRGGGEAAPAAAGGGGKEGECLGWVWAEKVARPNPHPHLDELEDGAEAKHNKPAKQTSRNKAHGLLVAARPPGADQDSEHGNAH